MDGYSKQEQLIEKMLHMQELCDYQIKINKELLDISTQINSLPDIPINLNAWSESLSDIESNSFKLSDFKKMFKFNKEYNNLVERRDLNSLKLRELVIDSLIDRIKDILK